MKKGANYALVGLAGYIAPRHLKAIKETGGELLVAHDIVDSVGGIDKYFPEALFTLSPAYFTSYLKTMKPDYLVVCVPNYLHYKYIQKGLKYCREVICEKPLVINKNDLRKLLPYNKRINLIMQLRSHPGVKRIIKWYPNNVVDVTYFTFRGDWYRKSWKMDKAKSGGLLYNIGVHIIDILIYLFGRVNKVLVTYLDEEVASFDLYHKELNYTISHVYLLIKDYTDKQPTNKRILINGREEINLAEGFENLHTVLT